MISHWQTKLVVAALLTLAVGIAGATFIDGTVLISRAANNRTITVQYDGVNAATIEMRVNGKSITSRVVDDSRDSGETNFALNTALLKDGENTIEIRLYDRKGKLVAHETSIVSVVRKPTGPVFLERPKAGATVQGRVSIKLGFQQNLRNVYVSFYIDDKFKSLRNVPPYTYLWDTRRVKNGWHEVQAWIVDQNNRTYKTEKMRLFVNNPSGRTESRGVEPRRGESAAATDKGAPTTGSATDSRATDPPVGESTNVTDPAAPKAAASVAVNDTELQTSDPAGSRLETDLRGTATGQRLMTPTGERVALLQPDGAAAVSPSEPYRLVLSSTSYGAGLAEGRTFAISLNGNKINFDVMPTVAAGVPLTPFRHLFEEAGGAVRWTHETKEVDAEGLGYKLWFKIGEEYGLVDGTRFLFELAPYIQDGRAIVPLSFIQNTLEMNVQYDAESGHVLITTVGSK